MEDVDHVLRILFALNQQWAPSWKWIELEARRLTIGPDRPVERINSILPIPNPKRSIDLSIQLIIDTLELIPLPHDVAYALASVRERLRARAP